jgi:hypothetical protein
MARDYTKYTVEGLAENLNKRKLVFTIVKDWAEKNKPSFEELQKVFPDELQGRGVVMKESEVKHPKRFNMKEPLSIKNGMHVVVSNQWGDNISNLIAVAEDLGYTVSKSEVLKPKNTETSLIDFSNFSIRSIAAFFQSKEENQAELNAIDTEIEDLLDESPKYYILGQLFEKYGFEYFRKDVKDYFSLAEDTDDLFSLLKEKPLLSILIEKENLTETEISSDNLDFVLWFSSYFIHALELLIETDNNEMIAEFIIRQSISTIEDDYNVESDMGDWISDMTIELIENIYNFDIQDYDNECEIDGYYFGQGNSMGYDYNKYAQDIIDALI